MAKQIIDLTAISLLLSDCTIDWCKTIADGTTVATSGAALIERGNGIYVFDNPDVTEDSDFRIHQTAISTNYAVGYLSPIDLSDIKTLIDTIDAAIDAVDTSSEMAARFTEIKGAGFTDENLENIKNFVDELETRLTQVRADGMPPATMSRV